jgi:antibiotic biosynthesis monooxygenase (ABM) superfamily enzyme
VYYMGDEKLLEDVIGWLESTGRWKVTLGVLFCWSEVILGVNFLANKNFLKVWVILLIKSNFMCDLFG